MIFPEIKNCIARWNKAAGVKQVAIKLKTNEDGYTFSRYEIYKTKEKTEKAADQETEIRKLKAEQKFLNENN